MSHSQIYFVDETGSFWPVTTVTYKWNEAQGVDSFYVSSCPRSGLICPHVVEYNGASGSPDPICNTAYGCTTRTLLAGSAKHYGTPRVYLNNATVNTATQARKTTCHELGHVLGLEHRYAGVNSSCIPRVKPHLYRATPTHTTSMCWRTRTLTQTELGDSSSKFVDPVGASTAKSPGVFEVRRPRRFLDGEVTRR